MFEKNNYNQDGIFLHETDDLSKMYAMIIGPSDTPYQHGFYFFEITFPSTYPFMPPNVKFITSDPYKPTRLHPNLYIEGKVCLSILGTWGGPEWTSALTIGEVLITIKSLMTQHTLRNEPGYEKYADTNSQLQNYDRIIEYRNMVITEYYLREIKNISHIDVFADVIFEYFLTNIDKYMNTIDGYIKKHGNKNKYSCRYQSLSTTTNWEELKNKLNQIKSNKEHSG
jgi:ubiquitin-conjugating enzyme E2 Z